MLPASFASFGSWSGACKDLQGGIQPAPPRTGGRRVVRTSDGSGGRYVLVRRCPFRSPASPASSPPSSALFPHLVSSQDIWGDINLTPPRARCQYIHTSLPVA